MSTGLTHEEERGLTVRHSYTFSEFAAKHGISVSLVKRAASHGLISVLYFGDRPHISSAEDERIARQGLPNIPRGYVRKTAGQAKGGRPRKDAKPAKTKAKQGTKSRRRKADAGEGAAT